METPHEYEEREAEEERHEERHRQIDKVVPKATGRTVGEIIEEAKNKCTLSSPDGIVLSACMIGFLAKQIEILERSR